MQGTFTAACILSRGWQRHGQDQGNSSRPSGHIKNREADRLGIDRINM